VGTKQVFRYDQILKDKSKVKGISVITWLTNYTVVGFTLS